MGVMSSKSQLIEIGKSENYKSLLKCASILVSGKLKTKAGNVWL